MSERASLVFIGHSTVLLRMGPLHVITDPNFSRWIWTLRRKEPPGMKPQDVPPVDLVLISHGHYDHLDMRSLRRLHRAAAVVVPPGLEAFPRRAGFADVRTLRWWETTAVRGLRITAVPAEHFRGRSPLTPGSLYQGYIVNGGKTVYYAGDTGLCDAMGDIGRRYSVQVALLPIGAYNPWARFGHHMSPEDAVEAFRRLNARFLVPIHWGAFRLSLEPMDEPPRRLEEAARRAGCADRVRVLRPGERLEF